MEKTLDEQLFEKLKEIRRLGHRKHFGMPQKTHLDRPFRFERPEGMCYPDMEHLQEGLYGMEREHRTGHRPHPLHRERILSMILDADEKGLNQKQLTEQLHINPSSVSEMVDKLEADRYVERIVNQEDKRSTLITLTEKGKARAYEVKDEYLQQCSKLFSALSEEEKTELLRLLNKLTVNEES
ncbi:MAG: MarR family transcriptional regulator [Erysipelotrichaceae bacterium]|nr:MarR family transcriptional regulator [Erysipelotrichaceae bacterium]